MPVYRFAGFELDPAERRLLAQGRAITLTPKVFDTLVLLVERAGHVVSKDELMAALWPRGFVHESNLTKHIWLIRKTLGDSEQEARCIETVPKLGYRFIAPVQVVARGDASRPGDVVPEAAISSPASSKASSEAVRADRSVAASTDTRGVMPRRPHNMATAIALAVIVAGGALVWTLSAQKPEILTRARAGTAVAIVDFNNLSQNAKDAWLGPALVEMLGIEIAAGEHVYVLPDELVRPARAGLAVPLAGGYAPQSLATLRKRLGADYVLSGSYLVSGAADAPTLRVDLALQDARSGTPVASVSQSGSVADLAALVTHSGVVLRGQAGFRPVSAAELQSVANAQPPTSDVARRIGFALDALHRNDPARARDELLDAIAQAPGYAPAYSYLAQAWSALGYGAKASAAAEQAAARAQNLPEEQRLQIEMQQYAAQHAWAKAAVSARSLVALRPGDPNYRLRLIQILLAASQRADAAAALEELRKLAGAADDPRTELAAADIASAGDDAKSAAEYARKALALARVREAPGQIADAQTRLGSALSHLGNEDEARSMLHDAIAAYQQNGNPHGEASAREALGKALASANLGDAGREEYQRAMAIYQSIGDLGGVAATYTDMARILWMAGDRDGSETAARHVLEISRETGDQLLESWSLQALATAASDEAASDEVLRDYREVITLEDKIGNDGGLVWALAAYADTLRLRGELGYADAACRRANGIVSRLSDPQFAIVVAFTCAEVAMDHGDIAAARSGFADAGATAKKSGDALYAANVELVLGQIDLGLRDCKSASLHLENAVHGFAESEATAGEADADALLALCQESLGDAALRDRAANRARELRTRITERQEVFAVDISLAILRARGGGASEAVSDLRALAADAEHRHWLAWSLEADLAAVEALQLRHDPAAATLRAELVSTAREHGFGWVLTRLGEDRSKVVAAQH